MISFLFTTLFGVCFVFAMALLTIGFMFVVRVMTIVWFDKDFMDIIRGWFRGS